MCEDATTEIWDLEVVYLGSGARLGPEGTASLIEDIRGTDLVHVREQGGLGVRRRQAGWPASFHVQVELTTCCYSSA